MSDTEKSQTALLTNWPPLGPAAAGEVAAALRRVAETFAWVPDGRDTAYTLRLLAHMLDSR
jgi:hypothetical protein